MDRLQRASVLLQLNQALLSAGSWAGETHMQKATFFLQGLMHLTLGFDFILYKHGPFSFDLRDELTFMRSQGFLALVPQDPYGPSLIAGEKSRLLTMYYQSLTDQYRPEIQFVSERLGSKTVADLERVATALYITEREPHGVNAAERLMSLKPHISLPEAQSAVTEIGQFISDKRRMFPQMKRA
jgi:uncharacterized protein YwgA